MSVLTILQEGDERLRLVSEPVPHERLTEYDQLIGDMVKTMLHERGIGLAAPQVGHNVRIIVVNMGAYQFAMVNPVIVDRKGLQFVREGCLSVARSKWNKRVRRAYKIRCEYMAPDGSTKSTRAKAMIAAVIQHEVDHLNGILFTDRLVSPDDAKYTDLMRKDDEQGRPVVPA